MAGVSAVLLRFLVTACEKVFKCWQHPLVVWTPLKVARLLDWWPNDMPWLDSSGSTTSFLLSNNHIFSIDVIYNGNSNGYYIRRVLEWVDGLPWMLAQTDFSPKAYRLLQCYHRNNLQMPLGQIIFNDPKLQRGSFLYAYISKCDQLCLGGKTYKSAGLIVRRSDFIWQQQQLTLTEAFFINPLITSGEGCCKPEFKIKITSCNS